MLREYKLPEIKIKNKHRVATSVWHLPVSRYGSLRETHTSCTSYSGLQKLKWYQVSYRYIPLFRGRKLNRIRDPSLPQIFSPAARQNRKKTKHSRASPVVGPIGGFTGAYHLWRSLDSDIQQKLRFGRRKNKNMSAVVTEFWRFFE